MGLAKKPCTSVGATFTRRSALFGRASRGGGMWPTKSTQRSGYQNLLKRGSLVYNGGRAGPTADVFGAQRALDPLVGR